MHLNVFSPLFVFKSAFYNTSFESPIVNFFYCICLLRLKRDNTPIVMQALKNFSDAPNIRYRHNQFAARMLLSYTDANEDDIQQYLGSRVRNVLANNPSYVEKLFALLLFNHFGVDIDKA